MSNAIEQANAIYNEGIKYMEARDWDQAIRYFSAASQTYDAHGDVKNLALSYFSIGNVHDNQGNYAAAIEYYQKTIHIRERDCPGSILLAEAYNNIGCAFAELQKSFQAIQNYQKAIAIYERHCPGSIELATGYYNIGISFRNQGDLSASIENHEKAVAIRERMCPGSMDLAESYHTVATAWHNIARFSVAVENYQKAINIREQQSCPDLPVLAEDYHGIANAYLNQGNNDLAIENYLKAIQIRTTHFPGSTQLALSCQDIGMAYRSQGCFSEAIQNYQTAIAIYERDCPGSSNLELCYQEIGMAFRNQGDYAAAIENCHKAIVIALNTKPDSFDSAFAYRNLGQLHFSLGDNTEAMHWLDKALSILSLGSEDYIEALADKIAILIVTGDTSTAQKLLEDTLAATRRKSKNKQKYTEVNGTLLRAQAELFVEQGNWVAAWQKIAASSTVCVGDDFDDRYKKAILASLYGLILSECGVVEASRKEFEKSKTLFEELHCQKTTEYFRLLNRIGEMEIRSNNLSDAASYFWTTQEYFLDRHPNSVFYVESLCGQANVLSLQNDYAGAYGMLEDAIQICEKNNIQCRAYRIAIELCKQVNEKQRKDKDGNKNYMQQARKQAELNDPGREMTAAFHDVGLMPSDNTKIQEGRRLMQEALESEDSLTYTCACLPIEYLESTSNYWVNKIGSGGFGTVYKARDKVANLTFAIKTILPDRLEDEEKAKFKDEIQLLSSLRHPNIIRVLGFCESSERLCMVLEFAAGGSLYKILTTDHLKARLTPNSRLYVAQTLVSALEYLHNNDVFHRDVKPENLCLWEGWESNPKMVLIDFGIASRVATTGAAKTMTSNPGTTPYMADEYLHFPFKFSAKSEVFSIGAVFVCLLTGDCSFGRFDHRNCGIKTMTQHIDVSCGVWPNDSDRELAAIAVDCLQKQEPRRPSVQSLRKRVKELRDKASSLEQISIDARSRITSFTTRSQSSLPSFPSTLHTKEAKRPSLQGLKSRVKKGILDKVNNLDGVPAATVSRIATLSSLSWSSRSGTSVMDEGRKTCIRCGILRDDGIVCQNEHFICSEGTCLEEMVREQLGSSRFNCAGNCCPKFFDAIDLYGKVTPLLYGELLAAMDRTSDKNEILKEIRKAVVDLRQDIFPALVETLGAATEAQLSLEAINSDIELLKVMAQDNDSAAIRLEKQMSRLIVQQERGTIGIIEEQEKLSRKIEALQEQHADGVSKLACGWLKCPRLFLILVRNRGRKARILGLANEYQLYFLCAHDHSLVNTSVLIKQPKIWIKKAMPIVKYAFLAIRLLVASYGIAMPMLTDILPSVSGAENKINIIVDEMANFLDTGAFTSIEEWVDEASRGSVTLAEYMQTRAREVSEEAYAALVTEAYKPENLGWMQEMIIAQKDNMFAWVKKDNVAKWKKSGNESRAKTKDSLAAHHVAPSSTAIHHLKQERNSVRLDP